MTSTPEPMTHQQTSKQQQQQQQPVVPATASVTQHVQHSSQSAHRVSSCNAVVSEVLAAMNNQPLVPAVKDIKQGRDFTAQFVGEVAAVQEHLDHFHNTFWPQFVEKNIKEGWTGQQT